MQLYFLAALRCQDFHQEVRLVAVGNRQDWAASGWAGSDRDDLRLSGWLQESLLAAVPLLMPVAAEHVQMLVYRYFVAVGFHTGQVASAPGLVAPYLFVRIPPVVKDTVVVRLGDSNLECRCCWYCR